MEDSLPEILQVIAISSPSLSQARLGTSTLFLSFFIFFCLNFHFSPRTQRQKKANKTKKISSASVSSLSLFHAHAGTRAHTQRLARARIRPVLIESANLTIKIMLPPSATAGNNSFSQSFFVIEHPKIMVDKFFEGFCR